MTACGTGRAAHRTGWIWPWLKRSIVNFLLAGIDDLEALVRSRLKQILYRPDAITGCLTDTGLITKPP
ncbi:hypothetical protein [Streptomyces sp. 11x1]|uniref:hypothetical protein n=1 Tax=Streptomyces sp. 11x1 TaxID=3038642 RepID=UPI00293031B8|nr:hypothetical protein [Streptomyces sp. 11x1]WNZ10550.1 hypothetical protein P8T65_25240 [Streptomyces sp. 11x1]